MTQSFAAGSSERRTDVCRGNKLNILFNNSSSCHWSYTHTAVQHRDSKRERAIEKEKEKKKNKKLSPWYTWTFHSSSHAEPLHVTQTQGHPPRRHDNDKNVVLHSKKRERERGRRWSKPGPVFQKKKRRCRLEKPASGSNESEPREVGFPCRIYVCKIFDGKAACTWVCVCVCLCGSLWVWRLNWTSYKAVDIIHLFFFPLLFIH